MFRCRVCSKEFAYSHVAHSPDNWDFIPDMPQRSLEVVEARVMPQRVFQLKNHCGGELEAFDGRTRVVVGDDGVVRHKSEILVPNWSLVKVGVLLIFLELLILSGAPSMGGALLLILIPVAFAAYAKIKPTTWVEVE